MLTTTPSAGLCASIILSIVLFAAAAAYGQNETALVTEQLTGQELGDAVRSELFWNPLVDSDAITVSVRKDSVILTGEVATWLDYNRAAQEAYEAGAAYVDNRLTVRRGGRNSTDQGVDPSIMLWPRPASPEDRIQ